MDVAIFGDGDIKGVVMTNEAITVGLTSQSDWCPDKRKYGHTIFKGYPFKK